MRNEDGTGGAFSDTDSMSSNRSAFSGPLGGNKASKKSPRFNLPPHQAGALRRRGSSLGSTDGDGDAYVEITLEIRDDSVAVHSVKTTGAGGSTSEDPELAVLQRKNLEKKSSFRSLLFQNTQSKFRQVSQELKRVASFSRRPSNRVDRGNTTASHALKGLKFIAGGGGGASGWQQVEERFNDLTKHHSSGRLKFSFFGECIGIMNEKESKGFADELFRAVAKRVNISGDSFNKEQLEELWKELSDESFDARLQIFFDMVDKDADGRITQEEVAKIITLSASANKLKNISDQAKEYAALIMEELDPVNAGYIMVRDLEMLLLQAPDQSVQITDSRIFSQLLSQQLNPTGEKNPVYQWSKRAKYFVIDHWKRIWVMILYLAIVSGLFAYKFVQYRNKAAFGAMGYCVCVAKGGAETLKFNMALILLPVCRNTITWLRSSLVWRSRWIAVGVGLHAVSHLTCDFPRIIHATPEQYEPMKKYFGEEQPDNYWWFIKGVEGITGILMVVLMGIAFTLAMPWFRLKVSKTVDPPTKSLDQPAKPLEGPTKPLDQPTKPLEGPTKPLDQPAKPLDQPTKPDEQPPKPLGRLTVLSGRLTGFNAFWYTHHLFVIVYALLLVHGIQLYLTKIWYEKTTWMYLAVPVVLYGSERLVRALRSRIEPVQILKVAVYPADVLALHMSKPHGFKYKSGQYMFVNCSTISPFEWHPFSITSSPEDDYLSVHIRALGDWTNEINSVFTKVYTDSSFGKRRLMRAEYNPGEDIPATSVPKIRIDGPYGAPSQDYKQYDVVLLAGLGIGATPMVSIVKDIINNIKINAGWDLENGSRGLVKPNPSGFRTQKAYFYWSTREQGSFEWFKGMMDEVAEMDEGRVIEMHNYCTSVYEDGDARSALITMLQSIHYAKNEVDVVSGTRVKTHFGRPNWRQVYKKIAVHHPHTRVGVFYCGLPKPGKELRDWALVFSHKTSTKFEFHKENF